MWCVEYGATVVGALCISTATVQVTRVTAAVDLPRASLQACLNYSTLLCFVRCHKHNFVSLQCKIWDLKVFILQAALAAIHMVGWHMCSLHGTGCYCSLCGFAFITPHGTHRCTMSTS